MESRKFVGFECLILSLFLFNNLCTIEKMHQAFTIHQSTDKGRWEFLYSNNENDKIQQKQQNPDENENNNDNNMKNDRRRQRRLRRRQQ